MRFSHTAVLLVATTLATSSFGLMLRDKEITLGEFVLGKTIMLRQIIEPCPPDSPTLKLESQKSETSESCNYQTPANV
ncbi:hypothetical protein C0995_009841 [Termitomyces sp. Mi166|nr:hypothetical protein C0995_009841 [Termitomyces sp. Mi166\